MGFPMTQTRFPALFHLLTGDLEAERRRALEDLKFAQHKRQTQAEHAAFKKARALTCQALRHGQ
jgi:hypothetical protein